MALNWQYVTNDLGWSEMLHNDYMFSFVSQFPAIPLEEYVRIKYVC